MDRVVTAVAGAQVHAADINSIQDNALGIAQFKYAWWGRPPTLQSLSTTSINIGACEGLLLDGVGLTATGSTNLAAGSGTFPAMANNTWYYVYAYNNSGAVGYEVSTGVPDSSLTLKSGDPTRRYVGCFRSDGSAHVVPFAMSSGRYVYRYGTLPGGAGTDFLLSLPATHSAIVASAVLNDSGAAQTLLPPHATRAIIRAKLYSNVAASTASIARNGDLGGLGAGYNMEIPNHADYFTYEHIEIQTNGQTLDYITDANASTSLAIWTLGFWE
jgi:hypothetical protein